MQTDHHTLSHMDRAVQIAGSQIALAERIGTTQQNVSLMVKNGRPSPRFAPAIAKLLKARPEKLWPELFAPRRRAA